MENEFTYDRWVFESPAGAVSPSGPRPRHDAVDTARCCVLPGGRGEAGRVHAHAPPRTLGNETEGPWRQWRRAPGNGPDGGTSPDDGEPNTPECTSFYLHDGLIGVSTSSADFRHLHRG